MKPQATTKHIQNTVFVSKFHLFNYIQKRGTHTKTFNLRLVLKSIEGG